METQYMRVATNKLITKSQFNLPDRLKLLFGARHEFVYQADYLPLQLVNATWKGALGHLINDNK